MDSCLCDIPCFNWIKRELHCGYHWRNVGFAADGTNYGLWFGNWHQRLENAEKIIEEFISNDYHKSFGIDTVFHTYPAQ